NPRQQAGTRDGITDSRVPALIDSYAGHEAPQAVVTIAPILLLDRRGGKYAACDVKLIPAHNNRSVRETQDHDLTSPHRFCAAKALVNQGVMILSRKVSSFWVVPCCGTMVNPVAFVNASTNGLTVIRALGV